MLSVGVLCSVSGRPGLDLWFPGLCLNMVHVLVGCCVSVILTGSSSHLHFSSFVEQRKCVDIQSDIRKSYEKYNMKKPKVLTTAYRAYFGVYHVALDFLRLE